MQIYLILDIWKVNDFIRIRNKNLKNFNTCTTIAIIEENDYHLIITFQTMAWKVRWKTYFLITANFVFPSICS